VLTDLKKEFYPRVHLTKMITEMTSETHFAAFGSVQKHDLRCPDTIQLQISLVKFCSCGLGESDSHGSSYSKMADRTATKLARAKWRTEQPRN
jgi:hypothetical protein